MGLLSQLAKKAHDFAVEDDGQDKDKTPAPQTTLKPSWPGVTPMGPGGSFGTAAAPATSPFAVPSSVVPDEAVYQKILHQTDFDTTDVGKTVHKYYDALEGAGLDPNTQFKSALKQAAKLEGITPDKVLATFDSLKAALQAEGDRFSKICDTQSQREVVGRQTKLQQISDSIAQLQAQIADLQTQHTQISAELVDAHGSVANATTQFQLAATRRSQEIDQQKAQFASLLR
jgi:hypothetical protein